MLFHDLKPRDFFLESELTPDNIDNREDAIKYINRCIDECKNRREGWEVARQRLSGLEKEREEILKERKRISLTTGEEVSQDYEVRVLSWGWV